MPAGSLDHAGMQNRLAEIERLVLSLMADSAIRSGVTTAPIPLSPQAGIAAHTTKSPQISTLKGNRSEAGSMRISASEQRYVGGEHWMAIVDSIAELKEQIDREEQLAMVDSNEPLSVDAEDDEGAELTTGTHALLLYGCEIATTREEILAALPPKAVVDRYIARYFNFQELVSGVIHGPTFVREYKAFWADPSSRSIMWIGLLYGMVSLAALTSDASETIGGIDPEQQANQICLYRQKVVQCLVAGEWTNGGPYTLETMIHYLYIEFSLRADADKDVWYLLTLEVNLAIRMGYHRDPQNFRGISPLQGEMRRRVWATVVMGDVLISTQMGMPRMISDRQCDTAEPSNYNDTDLDESMAVLPLPRPESEITTALGLIARKRLLDALGEVSELTASAKPCAYAEVLRVDSSLHAAAASIPEPLKMKDMAASITDSPQIIMARLFLSVLLHKGQNMLHRRYLYAESLSPDEDTYAYSRKACLDAGLEILRVQQTLDEETRPGGQLQIMRWRVSSILNHQFLTATVILCSSVYRGQSSDRKAELIAALRTARTTWLRSTRASREAHIATRVLNAVLARASDSRTSDEQSTNIGPQASAEMQAADVNMPTCGSGGATAFANDAQAFFLGTEPIFDGKYTSLAMVATGERARCAGSLVKWHVASESLRSPFRMWSKQAVRREQYANEHRDRSALDHIGLWTALSAAGLHAE